MYKGTEFTHSRNEGTGIPERQETSKPVPHLDNTTQAPVFIPVFHFEKLPVFHYEIIRTHKRISPSIFHFSLATRHPYTANIGNIPHITIL